VAMMTGGRLTSWIDARKLMAFGIILLVWSIWDMTFWTPDVSQWRIMATITMQGAGLGFLFIPLQVLAFATLPGQYRTDGASLFSLFRNIGAAIGVSVTSSMLVHNTQVLHEEIGGGVTPFNRALMDGGLVQHFWNPATRHGAAMLDHVINQQAQIIAYVDDYKMMIFTTSPMLLLLLLMRRSRPVAKSEAHEAVLD
jgi:DHA2 family multidrug resistance protein